MVSGELLPQFYPKDDDKLKMYTYQAINPPTRPTTPKIPATKPPMEQPIEAFSLDLA